jgi:hypothetical protein
MPTSCVRRRIHANKQSTTGLWDEAKKCYAGALQSLVGSASRHTPAPPPQPRRISSPPPPVPGLGFRV